MLKNMKLGAKLGLSFGLLILIIAILGGVAMLNMKKVQTQVGMLSAEYAPEVEVANRIERYSLLLMYEMRAYGLTGVESYFNMAHENIASLKIALSDAEKLAASSPHLVKLKGSIGEVISALKEYESLINTTDEVNKHTAIVMTQLNDSAKIYMQNTKSFLNTQQEALTQEIGRNASSAKLRERAEKIYLVSDVAESGRDIRITVLKALSNRAPEEMKTVLPEFERVNSELDRLKTITYKQQNIEEIQNIKNSAANYSKSLNMLIENNSKLNELKDKREAIAQILLDKSKEVSIAGMEQTLEVAKFSTNILVNSVFTVLTGLIISVIVGILLAVFITKVITKPIFIGVEFAREVAKGNLDAKIDLDQKDEIGMLAAALKEMIGKLREIVTDVKNASENVSAGSSELNSAAQEMSQGATEQAAAAEQASSSMEEMASNINQNADNALQTEKIALKAAEDAKEGGNAVDQTVKAMKDIASKISIIEEIARQTNLLALNAAIEAARAGEHGKGFAVVASEVRKLAERSQQAAGEIGELSSSSVEVAERAGSLLAQILPDIQKTSELVQEITAASREQRTGADQINNAIQQLDQVIQKNAGASEEMASTAEELASQSESLASSMAFFRLSESSFGLNGKRNSSAKRAAIAHKPVKAVVQNTKKSSSGTDINIDMSTRADELDKLDEDFVSY
jgi:methyl-accepting chemotaxis protein